MSERHLPEALMFRPFPIGDPIPWPDLQRYLDKQHFLELTNAAFELNKAVLDAQHAVLTAQSAFNTKVMNVLKTANVAAAGK